MREIILAEIKRIAAANGGKPPGRQLFKSETGIGESKWRGVHWARWGDALADAGFQANDRSEKLDSGEMLRRLANIAREQGSLPTYAELSLLRRSDPTAPHPEALRRHFDSHIGLIGALRSFCDEHDDLQDVSVLLPEAKGGETQGSVSAEGWVYLLKSGQHYKIGRSDQLEARVKQISIALPEATGMVHAIRTDDPPGIEAYWHRRFADRRANGEWFRLTAADVAAFARRKFQ